MVLVAGGTFNTSLNPLPSAELYNVGLGFSSSWQPQIAPFTSPLSLGSSLVLTGAQFRGISEGSGGNNTEDSPADYPVVELESLGNEWTIFLQSMSWSTNSFISAPLHDFPPGYSLVTVFVNGIPSAASILDIVPPRFQITSIVRTNANDLLITWNTSGTSNIIQVTPSLGTGFSNLASFVITTSTTNYLDVGAGTNKPARFYRIELPQ
jgi:hypothetical protein